MLNGGWAASAETFVWAAINELPVAETAAGDGPAGVALQPLQTIAQEDARTAAEKRKLGRSCHVRRVRARCRCVFAAPIRRTPRAREASYCIGSSGLKRDPRWNEIRSDCRFQTLVRTVGLPAYARPDDRIERLPDRWRLFVTRRVVMCTGPSFPYGKPPGNVED